MVEAFGLDGNWLNFEGGWTQLATYVLAVVYASYASYAQAPNAFPSPRALLRPGVPESSSFPFILRKDSLW